MKQRALWSAVLVAGAGPGRLWKRHATRIVAGRLRAASWWSGTGSPVTRPPPPTSRRRRPTSPRSTPASTVEFVAQPFDQYYTLLGAAIQSGKGPDVMLFNGGGQIRDRVDALLPLDQYVAEDKQRLAGLGGVQQGRQDLRRAGDAAGPPDLLQQDALREGRPRPGEPGHDLGRVRRRLRHHHEGDRRQVLRARQQGGRRHPVLPLRPRLGHPHRRRSTTTGSPASATGPRPNVKRIFQLWKEANDAGLNNDGANSTAMFNDCLRDLPVR